MDRRQDCEIDMTADKIDLDLASLNVSNFFQERIGISREEADEFTKAFFGEIEEAIKPAMKGVLDEAYIAGMEQALEVVRGDWSVSRIINKLEFMIRHFRENPVT
jgi:hypothetical protein